MRCIEDWWSHLRTIVHHLVHETIDLSKVWIFKIKMEFLTIDIGIENKVRVRFKSILLHWWHWEWSVIHWWHLEWTLIHRWEWAVVHWWESRLKTSTMLAWAFLVLTSKVRAFW